MLLEMFLYCIETFWTFCRTYCKQQGGKVTRFQFNRRNVDRINCTYTGISGPNPPSRNGYISALLFLLCFCVGRDISMGQCPIQGITVSELILNRNRPNSLICECWRSSYISQTNKVSPDEERCHIDNATIASRVSMPLRISMEWKDTKECSKTCFTGN
jgi:hypothetical protein